MRKKGVISLTSDYCYLMMERIGKRVSKDSFEFLTLTQERSSSKQSVSQTFRKQTSAEGSQQGTTMDEVNVHFSSGTTKRAWV